MRRAIASVLAVGIISTLLPVMPTTATAEAGEVQILHGWQVGGYGGTTFHLVTQKIGGYTAVREGDTIVLTSTGGGSGSSESILYSFPLGTVTRDDRIAALQQGKQAQLKFVDPLSRTYQPFPYYTDFSFVQWLTGTQRCCGPRCARRQSQHGFQVLALPILEGSERGKWALYCRDKDRKAIRLRRQWPGKCRKRR